MKGRFVVAVALFTFFILLNTSIVHAQWSAINSGYAVTSNWHGMETPIGQSVVVTAGTIDPSVETIEFKWRDPNKTLIFDETFPVALLTTPDVPSNVPQEVVDWATNNPGVKYWYAQSTYSPEIFGDWGVQVLFLNSGNTVKSQGNEIISIRATSFEATPEVPFGTIAISLIMLVVLGSFMMKRKRGFQ